MYIVLLGFRAPFLYRDYRAVGFYSSGSGLPGGKTLSFYKHFGFNLMEKSFFSLNQLKTILTDAYKKHHYLIASTGDHLYIIQPYLLKNGKVDIISPIAFALRSLVGEIDPKKHFKKSKDFCICLNAHFHNDYPDEAFVLNETNFSIVSLDVVFSTFCKEYPCKRIYEVKGVTLKPKTIAEKPYIMRSISKQYKRLTKAHKEKSSHCYTELSTIMNECLETGDQFLQEYCYYGLQQIFQDPIFGKQYKAEFDKNLPMIKHTV